MPIIFNTSVLSYTSLVCSSLYQTYNDHQKYLKTLILKGMNYKQVMLRALS